MIKYGPILEQSRIPGMGALFIVYKGSAKTEPEGFRGISHLVEHLLCKSYDPLLNQLYSIGIESNTYTSDEEVVFHWTGLNDKIEDFQEQLIKLITYTPTEKQFNIEKNIVIQEHNNYISQQNYIFQNITRKYLNYFGAIGKLEDIQNISYDQLINFIENNFRKPTSIIRLGDSNTFNQIIENIQFNQSHNEPHLTLTNLEENVIISSKFPGATLICDWNMIDTNTINYQNLQIINLMWADGLSSPLYQEVREKKGLAYSIGIHPAPLNDSQIINYLWCQCNPDKESETRSIIQNTLNNWETHMTEDRFNVIVNFLKCTIKINKLTKYSCINRYITNNTTTLEYLETISFNTIYQQMSELANLKYNQASIGNELII